MLLENPGGIRTLLLAKRRSQSFKTRKPPTVLFPIQLIRRSIIIVLARVGGELEWASIVVWELEMKRSRPGMFKIDRL